MMNTIKCFYTTRRFYTIKINTLINYWVLIFPVVEW